MSNIGFIGLGMMGLPMAHRLHEAGHSLVVRDSNAEVLSSFVSSHTGVSASNDAEAFASCDAVITMLPNSDIVDSVVKSLAQHLKTGACIIDMSSADPIRTRSLAANLGESGISLIDAPVSGGVKKAVAGTLAIMVGGEAIVFERYRPLLNILGKSITYVGPVGAGHALKALNNYVSAAALIATAEAIHVGVAFSIDAATVVDVINASTGKNNTTENKAHQFMLNGAFDSGFSLLLQAKDVGIAAELGLSVGNKMDLAQKIKAITKDASSILGPAADHTELFRYLGTV